MKIDSHPLWSQAQTWLLVVTRSFHFISSSKGELISTGAAGLREGWTRRRFREDAVSRLAGGIGVGELEVESEGSWISSFGASWTSWGLFLFADV